MTLNHEPSKEDLLEPLFKKSKQLFKKLPDSRKEFDEVQNDIRAVLLDKNLKNMRKTL